MPVIHESPNKIRVDDFYCEECDRIETDVYWRRSEGDPKCECCGNTMKAIPGGCYHQDYIEKIQAKRPLSEKIVQDPLTEFCVKEGLRRRKERLAGTGKL